MFFLMAQYWLKDIDLETIPTLSEYLMAKGFDSKYNKANNDFTSNFDPNKWETDTEYVSIYDADYPVFIDVFAGDEEINEKGKTLVKKIIEITKAENIIDGRFKTISKEDFLLNLSK